MKTNKKAKKPFPQFYTINEEIANSITHGIGTGLSVAGLTLLVVLATLYGDKWQIISFSIYGTTLIILYLASTLYHSFQHPPVKRVFRIIDHAAIYLVIAGTYTPFLLVKMRHIWGWTWLVIIWTLALLGVVYKTFFINRFEILAVVSYALMGWMGLIILQELLTTVAIGSMIWLGVGGAFYTIGIIFYAWDKIPYNHTIWHLFVLSGSACHYFAILLYISPI